MSPGTTGVVQRINGLLLHKDFVANRAVLPFGESRLGAGRIHGGICDLGVAEGINSPWSLQNRVTHGAMLAFGVTGFGTGRIHGSIGDLGVAGCSNSLLLAFAARAGAFFGTVFRASGLFDGRPISPGMCVYRFRFGLCVLGFRGLGLGSYRLRGYRLRGYRLRSFGLGGPGLRSLGFRSLGFRSF